MSRYVDDSGRVDFCAWAAAIAADSRCDARAQRETEQQEVQQRLTRLAESGARGAIADEDARLLSTGTGLIETHALRAVQRWLHVRSGSSTRPLTVMVLVGPSGRGKTMAAAWMLARLGGRYVTAEALRRSVVSTHWRESSALDSLIATRCVVVDDAGGELDADSAAAAMFELVNKRSGNSRAWTLITSNLTPSDFAERYGERTTRRIEHHGAIVGVTGEDLRRGAATTDARRGPAPVPLHRPKSGAA